MNWKLLPLAAAPVVIGASLTVAFGPFGGGESSQAAEKGSPPAKASPPASKLAKSSKLQSPTLLRNNLPEVCTNLKLTPSARAELDQIPVSGATYYGACNGHRWWMTRFPDGSDGVFRDGPSTPIRVGSIAEARCKVPHRLLKIWLQREDCSTASPDKPADPEPPPPTVRQPDPNLRDSPQDECEVPDVPVPNYNPTDSVPDQPLPTPEELLPPRSQCPELYEGQREAPRPDGERRYPNGRTWIEQYNWCQVMQAQGVPCTVPPPP